ncbi:efflux RND transporter periplasmic adaptor subunit [Candidatus Poribacteria bacterium]|nr:efflux RND transporter periplasmic adaptor subunit [Candidatus Poribacteria bacterium]
MVTIRGISQWTDKEMKSTLAVITLTTFLGSMYYFFSPKTSAPSDRDITQKSDTFFMDPVTENADPVHVKVVLAKRDTLILQASGSGVARACRDVALSTEVSGKVIELLSRNGDKVEEGDILLKLEDWEYRFDLQDARSKLLEAQIEYGIRMLWRDGAYPEITDVESVGKSVNQILEEIEELIFYEVESLNDTSQVLMNHKIVQTNEKLPERIAAAKTKLYLHLVDVWRRGHNLQATTIKAPFAGFVADMDISLGEQISSNKKCMRILDLSRIYVDTEILETDYVFIRVGQKVKVSFIAYPGRIFEGFIKTVNPTIDDTKKTGKAVVEIRNPDRILLPGMFAEIKINSRIFENRLIVPKTAILEREGRSLLFVVRDGLAKWCYIETGLSNENMIEIVSSDLKLKSGEPVIIEGHFTITHDTSVKSTNIVYQENERPFTVH